MFISKTNLIENIDVQTMFAWLTLRGDLYKEKNSQMVDLVM